MAFDNATIRAVWNKARIVTGYDQNFFRKDACGAWIKRDEYGNRDSQHGWEIDHITPKSKGGSDYLFNLRPLQWQNNACRQDGPLTCRITAVG